SSKLRQGCRHRSNEMDGWIHIPRWDDFQHYKKRDPPWIKDYRSQMDNPVYLKLTLAERGLLHDLRLLYLMTHRNLTRDPRKLSRRMNVRVFSKHLESLNDAGFIDIVASTLLDQNSEKSREEGLHAIKELQNQLGWPL